MSFAVVVGVIHDDLHGQVFNISSENSISSDFHNRNLDLWVFCGTV